MTAQGQASIFMSLLFLICGVGQSLLPCGWLQGQDEIMGTQSEECR